MRAESGPITSRLFEAVQVDGQDPLPGRQMFPFYIGGEEYRAEGSPVGDACVDVIVSSVAGGDGADYFKAQEITVANDGDEARTFDIREEIAAGLLWGHDKAQKRYAGYVALVTWVEQLTGRQNLVIGYE